MAITSGYYRVFGTKISWNTHSDAAYRSCGLWLCGFDWFNFRVRRATHQCHTSHISYIKLCDWISIVLVQLLICLSSSIVVNIESCVIFDVSKTATTSFGHKCLHSDRIVYFFFLISPHFRFRPDFTHTHTRKHTHSHSVCSCETFTSADQRWSRTHFSLILLLCYFISSDLYVTRPWLWIGAFSHRTINEHDAPIWCPLFLSVRLPRPGLWKQLWDFIERFNQTRHPEMNEHEEWEEWMKRRKRFSLFSIFFNGQNVIVLLHRTAKCVK